MDGFSNTMRHKIKKIEEENNIPPKPREQCDFDAGGRLCLIFEAGRGLRIEGLFVAHIMFDPSFLELANGFTPLCIAAIPMVRFS